MPDLGGRRREFGGWAGGRVAGGGNRFPERLLRLSVEKGHAFSLYVSVGFVLGENRYGIDAKSNSAPKGGPLRR